jgi:hypothetical protein
MNLAAIMKSFQESISRDDQLLEAIENISGGDVRRALEFVRNFFGSGHVDTQKIAEIYRSQGSYYVPLHGFLCAVIYGDARYYDPTQSPIGNPFDLTEYDAKQHLLPIILGIIASLGSSAGIEGFVEAPRIYGALQKL